MGGFKVLIAVDGSHAARNAFDWYLNTCYNSTHSVILANIAETMVAPSYAFRAGLAISEAEWKSMIHDHEDKVKTLHKQYGDVLKARGIKYVFKSEEGDPGHHVCHIAKEEKVGLIVMGTRGMGTVRRTVLGSVSDYVLHHAHIPVAICHQTDDQPDHTG